MPKVREGTIAVDQIKFNQSKYPREHYRPALAQEYAEAMINGAEFPRIILEEGTDDLLDGKHRYEAYKRYAQLHKEHTSDGSGQLDLWPDPVVVVPCEWHIVPVGRTARLYALTFQRRHGLRTTEAEAKEVCREQYVANPLPLPEMSQDTGIPQQTLQEWLKDLMHRVTEERNSIIKRLDLLGWTQEEISAVLTQKWPNAKGMSRPQVSEFLSEIPNSVFPTKSEMDKLGVSETVKRYNLPEILVWALKLEGLTDEERLSEKQMNIKIQPYDVWQFPKADDRFGADYPGRIPGQLLAHIGISSVVLRQSSIEIFIPH